MSWNTPSDSSGPLWQSMHDALPTNSRAPRLAAGEIAVEPEPSVTKVSKAELRLISVYS